MEVKSEASGRTRLAEWSVCVSSDGCLPTTTLNRKTSNYTSTSCYYLYRVVGGSTVTRNPFAANSIAGDVSLALPIILSSPAFDTY